MAEQRENQMKTFPDSSDNNKIKTHQNRNIVDGVGLIDDISTTYAKFSFDTEMLVASVRNTQNVDDPAMKDAGLVTVPKNITLSLFKHPSTISWLDASVADWNHSGQSIL